MGGCERLPRDDPANRVYIHGDGPIDVFYAKMSRDIVAVHGSLLKAEYISHYPVFEIRFHYEDGTIIKSGQRTGKYDINFLSLGYKGEGPRYSKEFLDAAGCNRTGDEIAAIKPGDVIIPGDSKIDRITVAPPALRSFNTHSLNVSSRGVIASLHPSCNIVISPDGTKLAALARSGNSKTVLRLFNIGDNTVQWEVPVSSFATVDAEHSYGAPGFGLGFIAQDRLLLVGYAKSINSTSIILIDSHSGRLIHVTTRVGEMNNWFLTNYTWISSNDNLAVLLQRGHKPLLVSQTESRDSLILKESSSGPEQNTRILVGKGGRVFFLEEFGLSRYDVKSGDYRHLGRGKNDICALDDGTIVCGGGYDDGSGDCDLNIYNADSGAERIVDFGRDTVFEVKSAGTDSVLVCSGHGRRKTRHVGLIKLETNIRQWELTVSHIDGQYKGLIVEVNSVEKWALIQGDDKLSLVSLIDSRTMWSAPRSPGERIWGLWSQIGRHLYLRRYTGDEYAAKYKNGRKEEGILECLTIA